MATGGVCARDEFAQSFYKNKDIEIYKLCSLRCIWPLTKASIFSFRATSQAASHLESTMPTHRRFAMAFRSCPRTSISQCTYDSLRRVRILLLCFALMHIFILYSVCAPLCAVDKP